LLRDYLWLMRTLSPLVLERAARRDYHYTNWVLVVDIPYSSPPTLEPSDDHHYIWVSDGLCRSVSPYNKVHQRLRILHA